MLTKFILFYGLITIKIIISKSFIFNNNGGTNLNCNRASSSKYLTFTSPKNDIPNECAYTIRRHSLFVCQLRIQFDIDLMQPDIPSPTNGISYPTCTSEFMEIGQFKLCGNDRNQHIYIPFDRTNGLNEMKLTMKTLSSPTNKSFWKIQVTQLECSPSGRTLQSRNLFSSLIENARTLFIKDRSILAPNGCTQYFTEHSGIISSFNYKNGGGIYPGKLTYSICFHRTSNQRSLHLSSNHFELGHEPSSTTLDSLEIDDSCVPHVQTPGRSEDYLLIPESTISELNIRATYFCGNVLDKKTIISNTQGPLYIIFNSDEIYRNDIPESGFSFQYFID